MYLLQIWFNLSDPATEDAVYDSYAMRKFTGIDFMTEAVPYETTLCSPPKVSDNAIDAAWKTANPRYQGAEKGV